MRDRACLQDLRLHLRLPAPIDFTTQYAEISAIKEEYFKNIQCGVVDPDDPEVGVPAMRAKMEAAGLNDIIAEAQRQLDAYLASKGE